MGKRAEIFRFISHWGTNGADAFKAAIDQYLGMSDSDLEEIARQNKEAFLKYYEYGRAQRAYQELLDSVLA